MSWVGWQMMLVYDIVMLGRVLVMSLEVEWQVQMLFRYVELGGHDMWEKKM